MSVPLISLSVIIGLLLAETRVSARHQRVLLARGAAMPPGDVYLAMAVVYPLSFIAMGIEGFWRGAQSGSAGGPGPAFLLSGVLLFMASKGLKYWAIGALGDRWSFRVLVLPDEPLVSRGPYQYVAHPNYLAVVGELLGTAMMMEAWLTGVLSLAVFGTLLWRRVTFETEALRRAYLKNKP